MTPDQFAHIVLAEEPRIVAAITAGSGWEVWMQVEVTILLRGQSLQVAREVPFTPVAIPARILDFLVADNGQHTAIELKVESATNAGGSVLQNVLADRAKLTNYQPAEACARWAVGVAYSSTARQLFQRQAASSPGTSAVYSGQYLSLLVCSA